MAIFSNGIFVAVLAAAAFILAYRHYGRFLTERLLGVDASRRTPAYTRSDGVDFVPTRKSVLFGHHFASIAGLGPIVGPAVAVYWGWLPAVLWVVIGAIVIGAVHDLTAMCCSLRHNGRGIGDLTDSLIGSRGRLVFLFIILFMLALAMGLFAYVIAIVFVDLHPEAIIPVLSLMLIACVFGVLVYRFKMPLGPCTVVGVILMMASVWVGMQRPVTLYDRFLADEARQVLRDGVQAGHLAPTEYVAVQWKNTDPDQLSDWQQKALNANLPLDAATYFTAIDRADLAGTITDPDTGARARARITWIYFLLGYAFLASILPVWLLLQPRDYINSFQLYLGVIGMIAGLVVFGLVSPGGAAIQAPAFNPAVADDAGAPPWIPFLFITIACGACSGFHNLVASGTTARQIRNETDCRAIGYGSMLTEGMLAVLVILACTIPYDSPGEWTARYASWQAINGGGIGVKLDAFIHGAASFVSELGVSTAFAVVFMSVVVVSFAMTTLDSATRLLRFNIEEIGKTLRLSHSAGDVTTPWSTRIIASGLAVAAIGFFALLKIPTVGSDGATVMMPAGIVLMMLFGTSNQLLAGLGLLAVSLWLFKSGKRAVYTALPMAFMLCVTIYAMVIQLIDFWNHVPRLWIPFGTCLLILTLAAWLLIEGLMAYLRYQRSRPSVGIPVEAASGSGS